MKSNSCFLTHLLQSACKITGCRSLWHSQGEQRCKMWLILECLFWLLCQRRFPILLELPSRRWGQTVRSRVQLSVLQYPFFTTRCRRCFKKRTTSGDEVILFCTHFLLTRQKRVSLKKMRTVVWSKSDPINMSETSTPCAFLPSLALFSPHVQAGRQFQSNLVQSGRRCTINTSASTFCDLSHRCSATNKPKSFT